MALTEFLQVTNNCITVLGQALDSADTVMLVDDDAKFPAAYPYRLTIWDSTTYGWLNPAADPNMEIVEVTGQTAYYLGTEYYTITRAQESTTARDHAAGETVALLITAGVLTQMQTAINALETP